MIQQLRGRYTEDDLVGCIAAYHAEKEGNLFSSELYKEMVVRKIDKRLTMAQIRAHMKYQETRGQITFMVNKRV